MGKIYSISGDGELKEQKGCLGAQERRKQMESRRILKRGWGIKRKRQGEWGAWQGILIINGKRQSMISSEKSTSS